MSEADLVEAELAYAPPLPGESPLEMWPLPAEWVNQAAAYQLPTPANRRFAPVDAPEKPAEQDQETEDAAPQQGSDSAEAADPPTASVRIDPVADPKACPQPAYPIPAMRRGMQGVVTLLVAVDAEGRVTQVRLLESSGHGILDRAAQDAVAKWVFEPATENGEAVPGAARVPIRFRIRPND